MYVYIYIYRFVSHSLSPFLSPFPPPSLSLSHSLDPSSPLSILNIAYNQLRGPVSLNLASATYLALTANEFTSLDPSMFASCPALTNLWVDSNLITAIPSLVNCTSLVTLNFAQNFVAGLFSSLLLPPSLVTLTINNNLLNGGLEFLEPMTNLMYLDMSGNTIDQPLPYTRWGGCCDYNVTGYNCVWLSRTFADCPFLPRLQTLNLVNCSLSADIYDVLALVSSFRRLSALNMSANALYGHFPYEIWSW